MTLHTRVPTAKEGREAALSQAAKIFSVLPMRIFNVLARAAPSSIVSRTSSSRLDVAEKHTLRDRTGNMSGYQRIQEYTVYTQISGEKFESDHQLSNLNFYTSVHVRGHGGS